MQSKVFEERSRSIGGCEIGADPVQQRRVRGSSFNGPKLNHPYTDFHVIGIVPKSTLFFNQVNQKPTGRRNRIERRNPQNHKFLELGVRFARPYNGDGLRAGNWVFRAESGGGGDAGGGFGEEAGGVAEVGIGWGFD